MYTERGLARYKPNFHNKKRGTGAGSGAECKGKVQETGPKAVRGETFEKIPSQ